MRFFFDKIINILLRIFVKIVHYVFLILEYLIDFIDLIRHKLKKGKGNGKRN